MGVATLLPAMPPPLRPPSPRLALAPRQVRLLIGQPLRPMLQLVLRLTASAIMLPVSPRPIKQMLKQAWPMRLIPLRAVAARPELVLQRPVDVVVMPVLKVTLNDDAGTKPRIRAAV